MLPGLGDRSLGIEQWVTAEGVYPARLGSKACSSAVRPGRWDTLCWLVNCFFPGIKWPYGFLNNGKRGTGGPPAAKVWSFCLIFPVRELPSGIQMPGSFFGLTLTHTRQHCTRAVYESVGFAIRHILEIAESASGKMAREVVVCGGGSHSQFWNQVKADILQRPVVPTPSVRPVPGCSHSGQRRGRSPSRPEISLRPNDHF